MSATAIVTGAARGIGAATVDALVAQGVNVVAVDACRDQPAIGYRLGTQAELDHVVGRHADRALGLVGDVCQLSDMRLAVETAVEHFGRLDIVVAAAGVIAGGVPLWEMPPDAASAVFDVCYHGTRNLFVSAIPSVLASSRGSGRLVAVSSVAGIQGMYHLADYVAAKHAVLGLVRGLAQDLAAHEVTVNAVCPGSTDTAILTASAGLYGLDDPEAFAVHQPIGRLLRPEEVAASIAFLASASASAITGVALPVDGGMSTS
jgi:SDR family mycofactocin-dependent oxidoreductase